MGFLGRLLGRKSRATPEQAATVLGTLITQCVSDDLDRLARNSDMYGQIDARLCGRELLSLYIFAVDYSLYNLYKDSPLRNAIMQSFWLQYADSYEATPQHQRGSLPPEAEALDRAGRYADHLKTADNPLIPIGQTFSNACGPANAFLAHSGATSFATMTGSIQDLMKSIEVRL
jgi:hypothetical protein